MIKCLYVAKHKCKNLCLQEVTEKEMTIENKLAINYNNMTDEGIIEQVKAGDNNALDYIMNKYAELVNMKASSF